MSSKSKFIVGITLLFVIILVIEYRMPRRFEWAATFSHTDPQPFGCLVFDSVMKASMPLGYTVDKRSLWQLEHDSVLTKPLSLLVVSEEGPDYLGMMTLMELAGDGHTVMVATTQLSVWEDTLGVDWHWNNRFKLNDVTGKRPKKGLLTWASDDDNYDYRLSVKVYDQLIERTLTFREDTVSGGSPAGVASVVSGGSPAGGSAVGSDGKTAGHSHPLLEYYEPANDSVCNAVAIACRIDKGELILVSAPLLFTNYMTVSGNGATIQGRLMDRLKHHPVIRSESFTGTALAESSPFYVFLKQPPLRWALYLTLIGIVLFCIFTARRRQRAVPVIQQPQNRNLEFVQLIGTLYWQEHDNAGLLAKKLAYTEDDIRRQNARLSPDDEYFLKQVREAASGNQVISNEALKIYVKELSRIQQSL